jgi:hypothetical protein
MGESLEALFDGLDRFRVGWGSRPLLLTLAALVVLFVFLRGSEVARRTRLVRAAVGVALVGLAYYVGVAFWYAADEHFFDLAEPTMVSVAWIARSGHPLYHAIDAAERYTHIYGPAAFLIPAAVLGISGPSIIAAKLVGVFAGAGSLVLLYAAILRHASSARAVAITGVSAWAMLMFRHYSFWTRPDSLQLLAVAASLFLMDLRRRPWAIVGVGLASGLLWSLKFTGPLLSLPIMMLVYRRFGLRAVLGAVIIGGAVAASPFVLLPNVSFSHYLEWIQLSGSTGLQPATLRQNIEWGLFICLPLIAVLFRAREGGTAERADEAVLVAFAAGLCLVVIAAAKPGAGPYHLMPAIPVVAYFVARWAGSIRTRLASLWFARSVAAYAMVLMVVGVAEQARIVRTMTLRRGMHEGDDIRRFLATHTGVVEMAYGRSEPMSLLRPLLTFRNNSYLLDQPAVREQHLQGLQLPAATLEAVSRCAVGYWLVPKEETPFSAVNSYRQKAMLPLYPEEFRRAFLETHERTETTMYFDVWTCRGRQPYD